MRFISRLTGASLTLAGLLVVGLAAAQGVKVGVKADVGATADGAKGTAEKAAGTAEKAAGAAANGAGKAEVKADAKAEAKAEAKADKAEAKAEEKLDKAEAKAEEKLDKAEAKAEAKVDKLEEKLDAAKAKVELYATANLSGEAKERPTRAKTQRRAYKAVLLARLDGQPMSVALKQEVKRHSRRMAMLVRVRAVAEGAKDTASVERADKLIEKEKERHERFLATAAKVSGKAGAEGAAAAKAPGAAPAAAKAGAGAAADAKAGANAGAEKK